MRSSVTQLAAIKSDVTSCKQGVAHLKQKIAGNTRKALRLLEKKRILEECKRVLRLDLIRHKQSLADIKRLVQENRFVEATELCDLSISRCVNFEPLSLTSQLKLTAELKERFQVIRDVRLVNQMQHALSGIFKKQVSFDSQQRVYEQVVAGYFKIFPQNTDSLCLDLKMRLRDATRSKVNLVLLRYASETNCKWLSKLGVSPANYLKVNLEKTMLAAAGGDEGELVNGGVNLSTD